MNWKTIAQNALGWKLLVLGAVAGFWGSFLHETAALLPLEIAPRPWRLILTGAALGLGVGLLLAPLDSLLRHYTRRAWKAALGGGLLGTVLGALGAAAKAGLLANASLFGARWSWATPELLGLGGLILTLGLIGAACGLAAGLVSMPGRHATRHGLFGLIAGVLLALPALAVARVANHQAWVVLACIAAWSALLALALHWWRQRRARRWLRLVTGPGEDDVFPLDSPRITLGKHDRNDVPLPGFQEIYPYHCELRWNADHYDVVDNEQGGVVLVNYRQVQEHALKPGDLIKVGSALLQYGEAS